MIPTCTVGVKIARHKKHDAGQRCGRGAGGGNRRGPYPGCVEAVTHVLECVIVSDTVDLSAFGGAIDL